MAKTKKVLSTGRFRNRYGLKIRRRVLEVDKTLRARHTCPNCARPKLSRTAIGIWKCWKCGKRFAGGAYAPTTVATKIMKGELTAAEALMAEKAEAETVEKKAESEAELKAKAAAEKAAEAAEKTAEKTAE